MANKKYIKVCTVTAVIALEAWALYVVHWSPAQWHPCLVVEDEPEAHALYDRMLKALQEARSLSYTTTISAGREFRETRFHISLQKPQSWRIETSNGLTGKSTVLLGNSEWFWVYWFGTRSFWQIDTPADHEKTREKAYIKESVTPTGKSIGQYTAHLGFAWFDLILDPSLFHGRPDSHAASIDGIRSRGSDTLGTERCDVIEISYQQAQRTRYLWLSQEDHLPRRIKEVVRDAERPVIVAHWSQVTLNPDLHPMKFTWSPPSDYTHWRLPDSNTPP